ncbi:hypothetical protein COLO4_32345 [Corchorus olitorius]|uniref:Uncharacterized protein n=1 Tax=Corchorus olitorius TaxID=93759 RepID=A0A1R3GZM2_9ROSI|nr:hypothetical protein COLO4_32345 [Corchorus olitorius]
MEALPAPPPKAFKPQKPSLRSKDKALPRKKTLWPKKEKARSKEKGRVRRTVTQESSDKEQQKQESKGKEIKKDVKITPAKVVTGCIGMATGLVALGGFLKSIIDCNNYKGKLDTKPDIEAANKAEETKTKIVKEDKTQVVGEDKLEGRIWHKISTAVDDLLRCQIHDRDEIEKGK